MKRLLVLAVSAALLLANAGCFHHFAHRDGRHAAAAHHAGCGCGAGGGGVLGGGAGLLGGRVAHAAHETHGWRHQPPQVGPAGPPVGTYAYPYYTLRGPRDFLVDDPPSLGN